MSLHEEVEEIVVFGDADKGDIDKIINKILDAAVEAVEGINGATFTCSNRAAPIVVIVERSWKEGKHIRRDDVFNAINKLRGEQVETAPPKKGR